MRQARFGNLSPTTTDETALPQEELKTALSTEIQSLDEFINLTAKVLTFINDAIVDETVVTTRRYRNYTLFTLEGVTGSVQSRPVNSDLFVLSPSEFRSEAELLVGFLQTLKDGQGWFDDGNAEYAEFVDGGRFDSIVYTMAQGVGVALDAVYGEANSARKNAGMRFEDLMRVLFDACGVPNGRRVFQLQHDEGDGSYRCEADAVLSNQSRVRSTPTEYSEGEVLVSMKTTSKDRMSKIFTDKQLLSGFFNEEVPVISLFLHDVQRSGESGVSGTFVPNRFYTYHEYLSPLEGTYYLDPPLHSEEPRFRDKISPLSELFCNDLWGLMS